MGFEPMSIRPVFGRSWVQTPLGTRIFFSEFMYVSTIPLKYYVSSLHEKMFLFSLEKGAPSVLYRSIFQGLLT